MSHELLGRRIEERTADRLLTGRRPLPHEPALGMRKPARLVRNHVSAVCEPVRLMRNSTQPVRKPITFLRRPERLVRKPVPLARKPVPDLRDHDLPVRNPARLPLEPAWLLRPAARSRQERRCAM